MTIRKWEKRRILVTVKSYPRPSSSHGETVCVAGITDEGQWIRLYPVTYRDLPRDQQFDKYDWIEANVSKSTVDYRDETYNVDHESIRLVGHVGTDRNWEERRRLILPLLDPSLEALQASSRSLGLIHPAQIYGFEMVPDATDWSPEKKAYLAQQTLFTRRQGVLEKVPWMFKYHFKCEREDCQGHRLNIVDWEVFQSYRKWRRDYGKKGHIQAMRRKYDQELVRDRDLYFFVGTPLAQDRFRTFMIIGLFYPPKGTASYQLHFDLH